MSFGGLIYYGMKFTEQHSYKADTAIRPPSMNTTGICVGCCNAEVCKNTNCNAYPKGETK